MIKELTHEMEKELEKEMDMEIKIIQPLMIILKMFIIFARSRFVNI